ncbi:DEAD/DEAH box helicase family protein (plasmid) [Azospirillum sp. HJ39]|uniref:DEAD/DEAH box helicase n=1 Tax=Azospirillum sp. HJ39 TaxID=3159496 RepID=UPI00355622F2
MKLNLRPYQQKAIDDLYGWMGDNDGNPLVVIPTGGGKSLVIAKLVEDILTQWPTERIIITTHVRELVSQNFQELMGLMPHCPAGINSAGLRSRDKTSQVLFCSIQSVHKKAYELQKCDLILVDEAHLIPNKESAMYRKFISDMRAINGQHLRVVGLTATPFRMDTGMLHTGDNALFDGIAHETPMLDLIEAGYLCPLISKATATRLDVTGVGTRGGEFIASQLEAAVDHDEITASAVNEVVQFGQDRRSWLLFGAGKKHCGHILDALRERGVAAEAVFGDTPNTERDAIIERFRHGKLRALVSINALTTGFNVKSVDLIALLRPTKSAGLYIQICGRGTRCLGADIHESIRNGKSDCLVLDFAGVVSRFGPVDQIKVVDRKKGDGGEAPTKECPQCESICHASARECADCGFVFPEPVIKIEARSSALPILSTERVDPNWLRVDKVFYRRHDKAGGTPSLCVVYQCGMVQHKEYVCIQHAGFPRQKACTWWSRRAPGQPIPANVDEALERVSALAVPAEIAVRPVGKYVEISGHRF